MFPTKLKLYYALFSPPARACLITAKLLDLELELIAIDLPKKEHLTEEFIKLNPQHTIPVLVDDGEVIWDSHAIITYLVSKYGKDDSLYPKDLLKRARVDQRLYFESGVVFLAARDFMKRITEGPAETEYNPKSIEMTYIAYDFLEKFLENDYLVGNTMTLADISNHTTVITLRKFVPIEPKRYPRLTAWLKRMESLPGNIEINEKGAELNYIRISTVLEQNRAKAKQKSKAE